MMTKIILVVHLIAGNYAVPPERMAAYVSKATRYIRRETGIKIRPTFVADSTDFTGLSRYRIYQKIRLMELDYDNHHLFILPAGVAPGSGHLYLDGVASICGPVGYARSSTRMRVRSYRIIAHELLHMLGANHPIGRPWGRRRLYKQNLKDIRECQNESTS